MMLRHVQSEQDADQIARILGQSSKRKNSEKSDDDDEEDDGLNFEGLDDEDDAEGQNPFGKQKGRRGFNADVDDQDDD